LPKDIEDDVIIVQLRDLSYEDAEKEILEYLQNAGKRRVYVSEIVEKLSLDIESVADILLKVGLGVNGQTISSK
jgi:predicted transcriptional regulator with HTH domain